MSAPHLRILSLGAGVQSTALLLASAEGILPKLDAAIFSDTGWEPRAVYEHLDRIEREIAEPAGIPIYRVSSGNIRDDALDPAHRFASMPLFVKNQDGTKGMARRQCTSEYKIKPIRRKTKELLGAVTLENGRLGHLERGRFAEQWIGISTDEFHRAKGSDVKYVQHVFPLLDLKWSRRDCMKYLDARGFGTTPKSACIGCPFHGNRQWRELRDLYPDEFADAVAFDHAIRAGSARALAQGQEMRGRFYLHSSLLPLDLAPIDRVTRKEAQEDAEENQLDLFDKEENSVGFTCSPFSCQGDETQYGIPILETTPVSDGDDV